MEAIAFLPAKLFPKTDQESNEELTILDTFELDKVTGSPQVENDPVPD